MNTPIETLCLGYPEEMATYMTYCRNLGFEEAPNYTYLKRLFRDLYNKCQFENDHIFDWTIQKFLPDGIDPDLNIEEGKGGERGSEYPESMRGHGNGSDLHNAIIEGAATTENTASKLEEKKIMAAEEVLRRSGHFMAYDADQKSDANQNVKPKKEKGGCTIF